MPKVDKSPRFKSNNHTSKEQIVPRSIDATELKKGEAQAGVRRALRIIRTYRPKVVCFIGKIVFNTIYNSRKCDWGWQTEIGGSRVYLMHFPIRGPAAIRVKELTEVKRADCES